MEASESNALIYLWQYLWASEMYSMASEIRFPRFCDSWVQNPILKRTTRHTRHTLAKSPFRLSINILFPRGSALGRKFAPDRHTSRFFILRKKGVPEVPHLLRFIYFVWRLLPKIPSSPNGEDDFLNFIFVNQGTVSGNIITLYIR